MSIKSILTAALLLAACTFAAPTTFQSDVTEVSTVVSIPMPAEVSANVNALEAVPNKAYCTTTRDEGVTSDAKTCIKSIKALGKKPYKYTFKAGEGFRLCSHGDTQIGIGVFKAGTVTIDANVVAALTTKIVNTCASGGKVKGLACVPTDEYKATGFKETSTAVEVFIDHV